MSIDSSAGRISSVPRSAAVSAAGTGAIRRVTAVLDRRGAKRRDCPRTCDRDYVGSSPPAPSRQQPHGAACRSVGPLTVTCTTGSPQRGHAGSSSTSDQGRSNCATGSAAASTFSGGDPSSASPPSVPYVPVGDPVVPDRRHFVSDRDVSLSGRLCRPVSYAMQSRRGDRFHRRRTRPPPRGDLVEAFLVRRTSYVARATVTRRTPAVRIGRVDDTSPLRLRRGDGSTARILGVVTSHAPASKRVYRSSKRLSHEGQQK